MRWLLGFSTLSATDAGYAGREPFVAGRVQRHHRHAGVQARRDALLRVGTAGIPHPRSLKAIGLQAELFGAHANTAAAEAFSVLRGTWDTHINQSKEV